MSGGGNPVHRRATDNNSTFVDDDTRLPTIVTGQIRFDAAAHCQQHSFAIKSQMLDALDL